MAMPEGAELLPELEQDLPRGRQLPLNSRRLTASHMRQIAEALELPTKASPEELHQLIEGRLDDMGRQSRNVQAIVQETTGTEVSCASPRTTPRSSRDYARSGTELPNTLRNCHRNLESNDWS